MHVPEQVLGGVLLRADFRAFYAMEREAGKPLSVALGEALSTLSNLYRMAWSLTVSERPASLQYLDFLDSLPEPSTLATQVFAMVDEALTPICPVQDAPPDDKPARRVQWSALQYEGRVVLGQSESEWWRSTFRVQSALAWEHARYHDPEGKSGRPMSDEEIEAINNRNIAMLMGAAFTDGNQTHRRA